MKPEQVPFNASISAAIRERNVTILRALLLAEPRQTRAYTPFAGGTWLHYAAREGFLEAVRLLLSLGVDVNAAGARDKRAPICDACLGGHEDIVKELLARGASLDTSDPVRNPLFAAIVGRNPAVVRTLLEGGIDAAVRYDGPSMKDMDAIAFAIESGEIAIAEEIAESLVGGDPTALSQLLERANRAVRISNT